MSPNARWPHPTRGHWGPRVTVLTVPERNAVVADADDVRWIERYDAVLVEPDRLRWQPLAEHRPLHVETRRIGQRRSKVRATA